MILKQGLTIVMQGKATEFRSVLDIIFKSPDILIALAPAGMVLMGTALIGFLQWVSKYLQHRNETRARMNTSIARLSLAPQPGTGHAARAGSRSSMQNAF